MSLLADKGGTETVAAVSYNHHMATTNQQTHQPPSDSYVPGKCEHNHKHRKPKHLVFLELKLTTINHIPLGD